MGWPRKNEECRLYRERSGSYLLVIIENGRGSSGHWEVIANVYDGPEPSLCSTSASDGYLQSGGVKRVEWSVLPERWKRAFMEYIQQWNTTPEAIRGFWKIKPKIRSR